MNRELTHIRFICRHRACGFSQIYKKEDCPKQCPVCNSRSYTKQYNFTERGELADNPRWSSAMGCNIEEIPIFEKLYPDSVYHPETGDLLIKNRQHKTYERKRRGYEELD